MRRDLALITGASSGIGYELARLFAQDGYDLVFVARRRQKLEELGREVAEKFGVDTTVLAEDLSDPSSPPRVLEELTRRSLRVDVLVNNAGFGVYGFFAETSLERELEMIRVNVTAVTQLTKLLLPGMIERRRGRILNVASTAAFQPGPLMAVYYATKAYVLSFSEALANELHGTGVTVTALCPGPTITEFQKTASLEQSRLFSGPLVMEAAATARAGYEGMKKGKRLVIPGAANRLLVQAVRATPRRLVTALARRLQQRRGGSR